MEETKPAPKLRNKKGQFIFNGGKKAELRDKPCKECGKLIMRKSTFCRACSQLGERSNSWKHGNGVYFSIHNWINKHFGQPKQCEICKSTNAKRYEWANISYEYKRNRKDWMRLCAKCHDAYDRNRNWGKITKTFNLTFYGTN